MIELRYLEKTKNPQSLEDCLLVDGNEECYYQDFVIIQNSIMVEDNVAEEQAQIIKNDETKTFVGGWVVDLGNEVPKSISLAQFYSWLQVDGIYEQVKAFIDNLPATEDNILAKNRFYNAQTVERNNPMFEVFKTEFGVTDKYIDDNFIKWGAK